MLDHRLHHPRLDTRPGECDTGHRADAEHAIVSNLGEWSNVLLSVIIFLLAFSSILGNYYYGQSNIEFITTNRTVLLSYRTLVVLIILVGSVASADLIWNTADGTMATMALVNLIAIGLLSRRRIQTAARLHAAAS